MAIPDIATFNTLGKLMIQKYERYLPTAFDESLTLLEKVNKVIEYVNETGRITNELIAFVEMFSDGVKTTIEDFILQFGDNLEQQVIDTLEEWQTTGKLDVVINEALTTRINDLEDYVDVEFGNVNAQLAEKANENEVRKKSVPIGLNDADSEMLTAIEGGTGTSFNLLSIPRLQSVTEKHTSFIELSSNLFNKDDVTEGYRLSSSGGADESHNAFTVSDYLSISPATTYQFYNISRITYYDETKNFISTHAFPVATQQSFTTPTNAQYARVSVEIVRLGTAQINEGVELRPYEAYKAKFNGVKIGGNDVVDLHVESTQQLDFIEEYASTNLFNKGNVTPNTSINTVSGSPVPNDLYSLTEFIPVGSGIKLTINTENRIGFYDVDKSLITSIFTNYDSAPVTHTTPEQTTFIRVVFPNNLLGEAQINLGETLLPYEPYAIKFNGIKIYDHKDPEEEVIEDGFVVEGKLEGTYSAPIIASDSTIGNIRTNELYTLYDSLVTAYPDYVTKTTEASNSLGTPIYRYDFKPPEVDVVSAGEKRPKMILISGIHHEIGNAYILYQTMKQVCENWGTDENLETLRWNVHFIVLPVTNIYAFDNGGRQNENGVDLARNFSAGWFLGDPEVWTYGGPEPLSELESQYVDRLLSENKGDTIYFGSYHNFYSHTNTNYFIWNAAAADRQINRGKKLISKMSRKWKKENDWLPQDDTTFFGHTSKSAPPGSEGRHAELTYGIQGSTFEICQQFMLDGEGNFSSNALTLGLEASVNWLILNLKHNI